MLILGGTQEARHLALDLAPQVSVVTSLAGRTERPISLPGSVRSGGFGGVSGLIRYLNAAQITAIVDATHPYAARMGHNAWEASEATGVPLIRLDRPAWQPTEEDHWIVFPDAPSLAEALPDLGRRVFLSLGGADLKAFAGLTGMSLTLRAIDPPDAFAGRDDVEFILSRGPFDLLQETALLSARSIDVVVSRNAGGTASWPKIEAARNLGICVAMIDRPLRPKTHCVQEMSAARDWVLKRLGTAC